MDIHTRASEPIQRNLTFNQVVYHRKSCRGFLDKRVSSEILTEILEESQQTPSNCNIQPWAVHIVSGNKLRELSRAIVIANDQQHDAPDFSFDPNHFAGEYLKRLKAQGRAYYEGLGVDRHDEEGRKEAANKNLVFFNAPHVAFLFKPSVGDNVRVASDIGMYAQTFLLSLTSHGLSGIPQSYLGLFAETIRSVLNISNEFKLMFDISFGSADPNALGNRIKLGREPISKSVTFHV
jgi:nitroreductase